ncbi:hypothetical protein CB0940_02022 [Cercospora beticola]|uniref:Uncharacterized protein n=1 Tax=Cercospora beticola TaxID=122368 RepID=A0A2G5I710_CERBT|nr:hypothetical protein CB0940_02022 [Cercospora beticola]PIB00570.1 hypothetical protein CB0940_02022 [Cercospora beticola]WPA97494.1 hypothetical protein RHO25_002104 [Cercospora beticola]
MPPKKSNNGKRKASTSPDPKTQSGRISKQPRRLGRRVPLGSPPSPPAAQHQQFLELLEPSPINSSPPPSWAYQGPNPRVPRMTAPGTSDLPRLPYSTRGMHDHIPRQGIPYWELNDWVFRNYDNPRSLGFNARKAFNFAVRRIAVRDRGLLIARRDVLARNETPEASEDEEQDEEGEEEGEEYEEYDEGGFDEDADDNESLVRLLR